MTSSIAAANSHAGLYTQLNDGLVASKGEIATGVHHRSSGQFATYRNYTLWDRFQGTAPTHTGDHGKQVRTGLTPARLWDETRPIRVIAEHERGISSLEDALASALSVSNPASVNHPGREIFGAVLEDSHDTFRVVSAQFNAGSHGASGTFVDTYVQKLFRKLAGHGNQEVRAGVNELTPTLRALVAGGHEMPGILMFARKLV